MDSLHTKNKCHLDFCCQTSQRITIYDQLLSATFVLLTADSLCCQKKDAATWIFCLLIVANEKKKRRSDGFMCIKDSRLRWCRTWLSTAAPGFCAGLTSDEAGKTEPLKYPLWQTHSILHEKKCTVTTLHFCWLAAVRLGQTGSARCGLQVFTH